MIAGVAAAVALAIAATIVFPQSPFYLGFFFSAKYRSETMRAPGNGLSGTIARRLMAGVNKETSLHIVHKFLDVKQGQTVIELGPGSGHALRPILDSGPPSRTIGIEISPAFLDELDSIFRNEIESGVLEISGQDAVLFMKEHIQDASVDRIMASNVIYFLNPLSKYLDEFYRVLKPGGYAVFGVKDRAKEGDPSVFVNLDWDNCIKKMEDAGFTAKKEPLHLDGDARYFPMVAVRN
mmetsp:Transcript_63183/g.75957  ORF Transcript_63183/g.75957 Transcript_63183/m.75957 type:complete len:237 (-) Transcript_63183:249-959(-)